MFFLGAALIIFLRHCEALRKNRLQWFGVLAPEEQNVYSPRS